MNAVISRVSPSIELTARKLTQGVRVATIDIGDIDPMDVTIIMLNTRPMVGIPKSTGITTHINQGIHAQS